MLLPFQYSWGRDSELLLISRKMSVIEKFIAKAQKSPKKVVLPEGEDKRVLMAARIAFDKGIAFPILLGKHERIHQLASSLGTNLDGILTDDPPSSPKGSDTNP